jgi:hypothetical protein
MARARPEARPDRRAARDVALHAVPAVARTPHAAQLERGREVTVNAIMPFSILALFWIGLTVVAYIAGTIARAFSGQ